MHFLFFSFGTYFFFLGQNATEKNAKNKHQKQMFWSC